MRAWLVAERLAMAGWGKGEAKGVGDLLRELGRSESTLTIEEGRVLRCLRVAKVRRTPPSPLRSLVPSQ